MRIKVSMGFFAFCNGRSHFSRVRLATISSATAYPRASLLSDWLYNAPFVTPAVSKMTSMPELRNPERASPGRPPATSALACAPDRAVQRRCIVVLFLAANISADMHIKTAIFEGQCLSDSSNPESRGIAGDFYCFRTN
jgi:hypothetical protein